MGVSKTLFSIGLEIENNVNRPEGKWTCNGISSSAIPITDIGQQLVSQQPVFPISSLDESDICWPPETHWLLFGCPPNKVIPGPFSSYVAL